MTSKKEKYNNYYMRLAIETAKMSYCERLKVGCVIVKDGTIISNGWNGMPSGYDNCCEEDNVTRDEVIHAEENAILKLTRSNNSSEGSSLYVTVAPCMTCSRLIYNSGIVEVYYSSLYRSRDGIQFLIDNGIRVNKI